MTSGVAEICKHCRKRATGPGGGCPEFTTSPDLPVIPNVGQSCLGLEEKHGGKSRFELHSKFLQGKLVLGYETDPHPPHGIRFSETPEPDENPLSLVVREHKRFWVDWKGRCYADNKEKRFIGNLEDIDPPEPTLEEIEAGAQKALDWYKKQLQKQLEEMK